MTPRASLGACLMLLAVPGTGAAQQPGGWRLTASTAQTWFGAAAENDATRFGPSSGLGVGLGIIRQLRQWEVGLELEVQPAVLRAADSASAIEVPSVSFGRSGAALVVTRTIVHVGRATVVGGAGMRADAWTLTAEDTRLRSGGELRLGIRLDAGPFRIDNMVTAGQSASPFEPDDLPEGYRKRALRWIGAGMVVSVGL
jgi:hypothetical protein